MKQERVLHSTRCHTERQHIHSVKVTHRLCPTKSGDKSVLGHHVRKHNIQKTVERLWAGSECVLPSCFIQGFLMPPKKRTRLTTFMHLSNLLRRGRDLLPSELPTQRDILRYGLLLREQSDNDTRNYSVSDLAKDIYPAILEKWKRANDLFKQPVINSRRKCWIKRKLHHEAWQTFWHS